MIQLKYIFIALFQYHLLFSHRMFFVVSLARNQSFESILLTRILFFPFIPSNNLNKQDKICSEVDKLLELTTASEERLANLPSDSLDDMLSSLQVSFILLHQIDSMFLKIAP